MSVPSTTDSRHRKTTKQPMKSPFYYIGRAFFHALFYSTQIAAFILFFLLLSKFVEYLMTPDSTWLG
jgi:hypothetical protein